MAGPEPTAVPLGPAFVNFTVEGLFPEEDVSSLRVGAAELPSILKALGEAKSKIERDIRTINKDTAEDVNSWFNQAKTLQDDINRSKLQANEIQRQAEEPEVSGEKIEEIEGKAGFLVRELNYNDQLLQALRGIKAVNATLDQVEQARSERRILDALHLLEKSWTQLDTLSSINSCKATKLLNLRSFELKSDVHDVFDHVWNALVHIDVELGQLSVQQTREDETMSLSDAVIGLKAYKEVDQRMSQLWHGLDSAIVGPRMDLRSTTLPAVHVQGGVLQIKGESDKDVKSLFADLAQVFTFLATALPDDLLQAISTVMMPEVMTRTVNVWLDSAVPSALADMDRFELLLESAREFCDRLSCLRYSGFGELQEWVDNAPKVWLAKCRESALDTVRSRLSQGLGDAKQVERVETQQVSRSEGKELATNGPSAAAAGDTQDWDAAWSDEGEQDTKAQVDKPGAADAPPEAEDDGADAWGAWGDEDEPSEAPKASTEEAKQDDGVKGDDDDDGDAWGWGDDEGKDEPATKPESKPKPNPDLKATEETKPSSGTREMTLKETYNISSMPDPVLALVLSILEDGAALTQASHERSPVSAAAAGLFSVPTLVLAMFRAISPYYYASEIGGNMYLYNDATYLAEKLGDLSATWKKRDDLTTRAQNLLRIDNDVKALQGFANRAYSNEMNIQKTIIRDLLGGDQAVMQQSFIESAVAHVRSIAAAYDGILSRSAWFQAVGSLVEAVAAKLIADVVEMPSIGQDEAFNIANLIAGVTELDDLFPPAAEDVPSTAQFVPSWLRLKYLSEVLQSNLREVRYLWIESELSLYFSVDEVVDLINASFEDNARTREIIREIKRNPHPLQG